MPIAPHLEQQLAGLSDEQLEALKIELMKQNTTQPSSLLNPAPSDVKTEVGKGIIKGLSAFGEGSVLGFQGRPLTEHSNFKDKPVSEYKPTTQAEALEYERGKAGIAKTLSPEDAALRNAQTEYYQAGAEQKQNPVSKPMSPYLQKAKDSRAEKFITTIEDNKIKKNAIDNAENALNRVTAGFGGKIQRGFLKNLSPNDPLLTDWQNIKMVLTDAQLLNTAKTKGAISDREMILFQQAAANNEITNPTEIKPVLEKLRKFIDAEEKSQSTTFKTLYGEDPYSFLESDTSQPSAGAPNEQVDQSGEVKEGQTATNPETGQKIIFKGGSWQPLK